VARNALIGLVRLTSRPDSTAEAVLGLAGWRMLVDAERPLGTVDLSSDPSSIAESIVGARLFSGYAGWDAEQLESEIEEGSWYVVPAEARDPISADPEGLWRRVLRRQGGAQAVVSGFPEDPAMN
jgi:putative transcriptional regulator